MQGPEASIASTIHFLYELGLELAPVQHSEDTQTTTSQSRYEGQITRGNPLQILKHIQISLVRLLNREGIATGFPDVGANEGQTLFQR